MEVGITVVRRRWVQKDWRTLWRAVNRVDETSLTAPVSKVNVPMALQVTFVARPDGALDIDMFALQECGTTPVGLSDLLVTE